MKKIICYLVVCLQSISFWAQCEVLPNAPTVYSSDYCSYDVDYGTVLPELYTGLDGALYVARWYESSSDINTNSYVAETNSFYPNATSVGQYTYYVTNYNMYTGCESSSYTVVNFNIFQNPKFEYYYYDIEQDDYSPFDIVGFNKYQITYDNTGFERLVFTVFNDDINEYVPVSIDGVFEVTISGYYEITITDTISACSASESVYISIDNCSEITQLGSFVLSLPSTQCE